MYGVQRFFAGLGWHLNCCWILSNTILLRRRFCIGCYCRGWKINFLSEARSLDCEEGELSKSIFEPHINTNNIIIEYLSGCRKLVNVDRSKKVISTAQKTG